MSTGSIKIEKGDAVPLSGNAETEEISAGEMASERF